MATYTVSASSGVVTLEADSIVATVGSTLTLSKDGDPNPVAVFSYWNYYTVTETPPSA